ncbi:asparagine synthase (glutamine-hydrolyzing) [Pelagibacteraceae bacterium]|nr:asparagine synthase (glutamine-hydrolyzing) [Pelagibacteraceae bacterium]
MCGLAFFASKKKISKKIILQTLNAMKNRGPDSQCFYECKLEDLNLYFLFSRLSIIDLKNRSNQPYIKKNCILLFNGEIYNYLEIKKYLQSKKIVFETNSDTEVLLESYKHWGDSFVNHLNGMWAFVLYNKESKEIIVSRDRYSEKPLFYHQRTTNITFASETKYINILRPDSKKKNIKKIKENTQFGYKSLFLNNGSFFEDIKIFPSGGFVKIKLDNNFQFKFKEKKTPFTKNSKTKETIRELLINSLKIRLRSDVPVAFSLSGGVDSNILAGIASKILKKKIFAYSIIDDDPRYNERKIIDYVVKKNNYSHSYINISKFDHFLELKRVTRYFNAPVPTINFLVQNYLMKKVQKDKKKVLISGIGADEIFTGYYHHFNFYFNNNKNNRLYQNNYTNWTKYIKPNIRNDNFKKITKLDKSMYMHSNNNYILKHPFSKFPYSDFNFSRDQVKNRLMNELYYETVPVMTYSEDLNSMMHSVENRNPYLDNKLIDNIGSINSKHYIQKGFTKFLLRTSFQDLGLNKVINNYKKTGFNYSFRSLFPLEDKRILAFVKKKSSIYDFLRKDEIVSLLQKENLTDEENKLAFGILTTKVFLDSKYF